MADLDVEVCMLYSYVDVWCCTDEYPPAFEIDCRLISHKEPFKFSDLVTMLPNGMWLHRKYDSYRNLAIVTLGENYNILLASYNYPFVNPDDPEGNKINLKSYVDFSDSKTPEEAKKLMELMEKGDLEDEKLYDGSYDPLSTDSKDNLETKEKEIIEEIIDIKQDEEEEDIFNEHKINEILDDLHKRRPTPKGAVIPLSVASSKKLTQNKFETNSPFDFKKAQKKVPGSDSKKKPKK